MPCPYCLTNHAGDCPRDPSLMARQAKDAAELAEASALRALAEAREAQTQAERAVKAAATAEAATHQAAAIWVQEAITYNRTHPGGVDRRVGLPNRRVGWRDDWIRWKNPERRRGVSDRRHHA